MRTKKLTAALAVLAATSLQAHHSGSMYQTTPVWVSGSVVAFDNTDRIEPHTLIRLESRSENGQVRLWAVEGPSRSQIERMGIESNIPQLGDTVQFCAFPYKPIEELVRLFPEMNVSNEQRSAAADPASPRFVAGHVMVTAAGERALAGPRSRRARPCRHAHR
jgi:hypothetical protein